MSLWKKISLEQFREIDTYISDPNMSDLDKSLFCTCIVYKMTEEQLDGLGAIGATKLMNRVVAIFNQDFNPEPRTRIGPYEINYDPGTYTFGQFITLAFYANDSLWNAHYIMATLADSDNEFYAYRADFFLKRSIIDIAGSLKKFLEKFNAFNDDYKPLFGVNTENAAEVMNDPFQRRYGWTYAAVRVAEHCRFGLEQAYELPVREAFNHLAYLKAKDKFDEKQMKKHGH